MDKHSDPIQNIFKDIQKIMNFIETKHSIWANMYETVEIKYRARLWLAAMDEQDDYMSYSDFWNVAMFQMVLPNVRMKNIDYWMRNPLNVPLDFRETLRKHGRRLFLGKYTEENAYYRMLNGLPPLNEDESTFLYLPKSLADEYRVDIKTPIHMLEGNIQNKFVNTIEFINMLSDNPDKRYLEYLGKYKISPYVSRRANDFDIIRYPKGDTTINPFILKEFGQIYSSYREYIIGELYVPEMETMHPGYHNFMQLLLFSITMMQLANKSVENMTSRTFLDDTSLHILLSMYGISNDVVMTKKSRRDLVRNLLILTKKKGTDEIYHEIARIMEYDDVSIRKLILHKDIAEASFKEVPLNDTYDSILKGKKVSYDEATQNDPRWWDSPEMRNKIQNHPYTKMDTKYITIESMIHEIKSMFEVITFSKMVLDNKTVTDEMTIQIPELFGTKDISVYDVMLFIISAMCMKNGLRGDIMSNVTELVSTIGYNPKINLDEVKKFLDTTKTVDTHRIMDFLYDVHFNDIDDIERVFNSVLIPLREYLEYRIHKTKNRREYNEHRALYKAIFTYDMRYNTFLDDYMKPWDIIKLKFDLSDEDLLMYKHFYPRTVTGKRVMLHELKTSRYKNPFVAYKNEVTWYLELDGGIRIYMHDLLNLDDLRFLMDEDDKYVFLDDDQNIIDARVEEVYDKINKLKSNELSKAFFQVETPILGSNGRIYYSTQPLSKKLKSGIFKDILIDKLVMDILGYEEPPTTYIGYLERKNDDLYQLLTKDNRFTNDHSKWLTDVERVLTSFERALDIHVRHLEHTLVGEELYFRPLVDIINRFKSTLIEINHTSLKFVMDDKIDSGGNSNAIKLFDEVRMVRTFLILAKRGHEAPMELYDATHKTEYHPHMKDNVHVRDEVIIKKIRKSQ